MGPLFSHAKWTCELAIKWTQRQKSTGKSPHFSGSTVHGPRPHFIDTPKGLNITPKGVDLTASTVLRIICLCSSWPSRSFSRTRRQLAKISSDGTGKTIGPILFRLLLDI